NPREMSFKQVLPAFPRALRPSTRLNGKQSYSILTGRVSTPLVKSSPSALAPRPGGLHQTQSRGVKTLDFAGHKEVVYERADWPASKLQEYFKNDTLAIIGYGSQGHGQGLNARDNGLNVVIGVREGGASWKAAEADGWVPGKTLLPINQALEKGTIIMNLLSDAAQSQTWESIKPYLTKGKTLYFSHGFSVVYKNDTGVVPPKDIDVILCAPKGSGRTVRTLFQEGRGINGSIAVWQDVTGHAKEKAVALGVGVGTGYLYETTFEKEVYSDLYGERGVLMGGIQGMFLAQYKVLRENGHTPSEAFNETVEEATQSLFPLIGAHGMDYMYAACSTTARRGALDWAPKFEAANKPIFEELYKSVKNGNETRRSLEFNGRKTYAQDLAKELAEIDAQEIWRAGKTVRALRPDAKKS
ncbi:ketol-acid reductoisomerase, partial [Puccinia sorghi]